MGVNIYVNACDGVKIRRLHEYRSYPTVLDWYFDRLRAKKFTYTRSVSSSEPPPPLLLSFDDLASLKIALGQCPGLARSGVPWAWDVKVLRKMRKALNDGKALIMYVSY